MKTRDDSEKKSRKLPIVLVLLAVFAVFVVFVMVKNSRKPERLDIGALDADVKGAAFIKTNQLLIKQLHGNWMPNDLFWPTLLLDNMPNFQIGELEVIRYNIRVLRDDLSRMRTTDRLDPWAEAAFTALSNDPYKWWFPSAESKWKLAEKNLKEFYGNLSTSASHFYPRADNLVQLLNQYLSLMGGINTRLINAPGDTKRVLTLDQNGDGEAKAQTVDIEIPWVKIDDNFYYAQGAAYALYESFEALRTDFMEVLIDKNSVKLMDKILEDLRRCHFEPLLVLNGDPDSIFANHSLNLSGMFNDARQKINSLTVALKQG